MRSQAYTIGALKGKRNKIGALKGKRNNQAASNSLKFLANVEGEFVDGHVRGANGIRWRVA